MPTAYETRILIVADPSTAQPWAEILQGPESLVWVGQETVPPDEKPEVIVTPKDRLIAAILRIKAVDLGTINTEGVGDFMTDETQSYAKQ